MELPGSEWNNRYVQPSGHNTGMTLTDGWTSYNNINSDVQYLNTVVFKY